MDDWTAGDSAPVVVALPAELDAANASSVCNLLRAAAEPGAPVIIADLTATSFCAAGGVHSLLAAHFELAVLGRELRLALQPWSMVWRMLTLLQADRLLPVYFSVDEASAPPPAVPRAGLRLPGSSASASG